MRLGGSLLVLSLLAAGVACSNDAASPTSSSSPSTSATVTMAPTTGPSTTTPATSTPSTLSPATTAPGTTTPPAATTTTATTTTATTTAVTTTTEPATLVEVAAYFLRGERLVTELREVPGPAVLRGALTELLTGPADDDPDVVTAIPAGTRLLDLALSDGIARVDLSREFESGGGSLSMLARITQVVFTATRFPNVDAVRFLLEGDEVTFLGGEGIELVEPQTRAMMPREITGAVIIDTPRPGDTVGSTFVVRGEGDVFEGDFPIEVWQDDELVGGVAPVQAGAWGDWELFETTVTVDADPGPIELRAYDAGGCGDDPECPPIIVTVVPLVLAA